MMLRKLGAPSFIDVVRSGIYAALEQLGEQVVADVQADLSVDVTYATGPRGGKIPQRSKPGEHPRKETGDLQASITATVEADAGQIALVVSSDCPYAGYLEDLNRPVLNDVAEKYENAFLDAMVRALNGR